MIQKESKLYVADNSGAKLIKCIRVLKKSSANLGDFVLVVLHIFSKDKKLVKKKKYIGLVISSAYRKVRPNGILLKFSKNRAILFFEKDKFAGTRIYGPLCKEIRNKSLYSRFKKLISYAHRVI
jgi:large subunit ribosomal protein L14